MLTVSFRNYDILSKFISLLIHIHKQINKLNNTFTLEKTYEGLRSRESPRNYLPINSTIYINLNYLIKTIINKPKIDKL